MYYLVSLKQKMKEIINIGVEEAEMVFFQIIRQKLSEYYTGTVEVKKRNYNVLINYDIFLLDNKVEYDVMAESDGIEIPFLVKENQFVNSIKLMLWNYHNKHYQYLKNGGTNIVQSTMNQKALNYSTI